MPTALRYGIASGRIRFLRRSAMRSMPSRAAAVSISRSIAKVTSGRPERRQRDAARADIADIGGAHGEEAAVAGERQLDLGDEVAPLIVAEKGLRPRRRELDRTAELPRGPQHQPELDEHPVARAEISADVIGQHPQLVGVDAEDAGELALLPNRAAAARMQRVAVPLRVVLAQRRTGLHRYAGDAVDVEVHRDDVVAVGECLVRRLAVAEEGV